jgi:hypothetical protein
LTEQRPERLFPFRGDPIDGRSLLVQLTPNREWSIPSQRKYVSSRLGKDESGSRVKAAFQELIASDVEFVDSHHQRKEQRDGGKPTKLADVYGSRWLTAGLGSVLLLWGSRDEARAVLEQWREGPRP